VINAVCDVERKTPLELFSDFYELQNNAPMSDEQTELVSELISKIWEDEV
jgi:exonuclease SbcD